MVKIANRPPNPRRRYLLSIHDVWPGNFTKVESHWQRLRAMGATDIALLVVPEYHGKRPIGSEPEFLAWLSEKSAHGSEVFLHGYRHLMGESLGRAAGGGRRNRWGKWINEYLVSGEAEFSGLPSDQSQALLKAGIQGFQNTGLNPCGFTAPTWHGSPGRQALLEAGMEFWETRFFVHHLPSRASRFAPPLAWWPAKDSLQTVRPTAGGMLWARALAELPLIKIAIHPGDLDQEGNCRALDGIIAKGRNTGFRSLFQPSHADGPGRAASP